LDHSSENLPFTPCFFSSRYEEKSAAATNEGLDTAGHAMGTVWVVFKIRLAIYPKLGGVGNTSFPATSTTSQTLHVDTGKRYISYIHGVIKYRKKINSLLLSTIIFSHADIP
jgi:hypothetical protein